MGGKKEGRRREWPALPADLRATDPGAAALRAADLRGADLGGAPGGTGLRGSDPPADHRLTLQLPPRQRRLLDLVLVLAVVALLFLVADDITRALVQFGDLVLTFFLSWLVAFVISGPIDRLVRTVPRLPRGIAVTVVYVVILGLVGWGVVTIAGALADSIVDLVEQLPALQTRLPELVDPIQQRLARLGLRIDLLAEAGRIFAGFGSSAAGLVGPLQSIAVASLGVAGTTLIVVILSIYIALDAPALRAFVRRLVPVGREEEWIRFERSVSSAFGGFLKGQVGLGIAYGLYAAVVSLALGLEFIPVTSVATGFLQAIPFFGPFVSWAPPVLAALFARPDATLPALAAMAAGWFVVMNVLQPRVMNRAIGLHPIVVLGSVLVGSEVAGVAGAIFGIPVAAVISAMVLSYGRVFGEERAAAP